MTYNPSQNADTTAAYRSSGRASLGFVVLFIPFIALIVDGFITTLLAPRGAREVQPDDRGLDADRGPRWRHRCWLSGSALDLGSASRSRGAPGPRALSR